MSFYLGTGKKAKIFIDGISYSLRATKDARCYFDITDSGIVSLKAEYRGAAHKDNASEETFSYAVSDRGEGTRGTKFNQLPKKLVVPNSIKGIRVTGFQPGTFYYNYKITELTLPAAVTNLPEYFCSNTIHLRKLNNTEQITNIAQYAFKDCAIENACFHELHSLEKAAFARCKFLETIDIGNKITAIPDSCFVYCNSLTSVIGGNSITSIGALAFENSFHLKQLPFLSSNADKITFVGKRAFLASRITFDWSKLKNAEFVKELNNDGTVKNTPIPIQENEVDFWTEVHNGYESIACDNRLCTIVALDNPKYYDKNTGESLPIGDTGKNYDQGCAVWCILHIHSALTGKYYNHPDEFLQEIAAANPDLLYGSNAAKNRPATTKNVPIWLNALGHDNVAHIKRDAANPVNKDVYKSVCDTLKNGGYVYTEITTRDNEDYGHVVVLYGINEDREVLVVDSAATCPTFMETGDEDFSQYQLYSMPIQNLIGPGSDIVLVGKN